MKYVVRCMLPAFAVCLVMSGCEFWDPSGDSGEMVVGVFDALDAADVADVADGVDPADATTDAPQDLPDPGDSLTEDAWVSCGPSLVVVFDSYDGMYADRISAVKVLLLRQTGEDKMMCADMDPGNLPPGDIDVAFVAMNDVVELNSLPDLDADLQQDYTIVALGYDFDTEAGSGNPLRAWACDDASGHVEYGHMTVVTMKLEDVLPSIVGTWNIESSFDLTSDLPPTVDNVLEILFKLFTEPADQLLAIMCDETILGLNQGNDLCASLFTDPENPDPSAYTEIGTFVAAMIDANALEMRKAGCPYASPDACSDVYYTFTDVGLPLQKFGTRSTMTCTVEPGISADNPDAGSVISLGDCSEEWKSVVFRWTLGKDCDPSDPECGIWKYSTSGIPGIDQVVRADISGAVLDGRYLRIDRHSVGLKYGALVNFAMQHVVIPGLFGGATDEQPAVDSYEDLIGALLGGRDCLTSATCCADFESDVLALYPDLPAGVASDACASVMETAIGYMRDQIGGMDEYGRFSVGTPDDAPAPLIDNDDDMVFDTIGTAAERCVWDAMFTFGTYEYDVDADFMGTRNQ